MTQIQGFLAGMGCKRASKGHFKREVFTGIFGAMNALDPAPLYLLKYN